MTSENKPLPDHDECSIERCTANSQYSIIPNEIAQDPTMSADATTVILYLLSCKEDWVIKPKNVWKAKSLSRDRVYKAFDELIELGYMQKTVKKLGNLKSSVSYKISFFKKYLRRPEIRDTEPRDTESQDALISTKYKKEDKKKDNVLTMPSFQKKHKECDYRRSLDQDQRKLHDILINHKPTWGEPLRSNDVCAWFLSKKFSVEQVKSAFQVYKQDCAERQVNNMGGAMRSIIKEGRKPRNSDENLNRQHAIRMSNGVKWLEICKRYAKIIAGNVREEIEFNQPKEQFLHQMESIKNKVEIYG